MTTYYTEDSSTFPAVDLLPLENTKAIAADMQNVIGKLVNRGAYLNAREITNHEEIFYLKQNDIKYGGQVRQLNIPAAGYYVDHSIDNGSGWILYEGHLQQTMTTSPQYECFIDIPYEFNSTAYISKIEVLIKGSDEQTVLPVGLPFICLRRFTIATGTSYDYASQVDTSTTLTQYRNFHMITQTFSSGGRPAVNVHLYRNTLRIRGAYGTGAQNNMYIMGGKVTFTPDA